MPGFKILGAEERAEVLDTMSSGVLMGYGFDGARQRRWRAVELAEALAACGVGAGDEVIVPPFTFVAEIEEVLWLWAIPVFAEIDATLCLDPGSVAAVMSPRLTPLWKNALGKDWSAQMTPDKARELFART